MNLSLKNIALTLATSMTLIIFPASAVATPATAPCNAGIMNELSIVPQTPVWNNQTQVQHYNVTACTITDRVTIEWVKIINPRIAWDDNPSNRTVVISETSMGKSMSGSTTWTAPDPVVSGMYGVITRYYATANPAKPEATAASSYSVAQDVCKNIADGQWVIPAGMEINKDGNCTIILPPTANPPTPLLPKPVITKRANKKVVANGQSVRYVITLVNRGKGSMRNVTLCDRIPAHMIYMAHTPVGYFTNGSVCWKRASIAPGKKLTVTLTLKVSPSFTGRAIKNTACATSNNAKKVCASATIKVKHVAHTQPNGGVTG